MNEDDEAQRGFFKSAISNEIDISSLYLNRAQIISDVVGKSRQAASNFAEIIRPELEKSENGVIGTFKDIPKSVTDEVSRWQRDGLIGAVDGTHAINQTTLPDRVVYGVAVATATSRLQNPPVITSTRVSTPEKKIDNIQSILDLQRIIKDASDSQSWTNTYREYRERLAAIALAKDGCRLVLIDGPLYTQNLLTKKEARDGVLKEIQDQQTRYIGFIKQPQHFHNVLGSALRQGEYWIFSIFKDMLRDDYMKSYQHTGMWISKAGHWVRCLYKLKQKTFEFECDASMVQHGLALLRIDPSPSLNHDIPFLLELVDRAVRAKTDASHISKDLLMSLGPHAITFENEREFRK